MCTLLLIVSHLNIVIYCIFYFVLQHWCIKRIRDSSLSVIVFHFFIRIYKLLWIRVELLLGVLMSKLLLLFWYISTIEFLFLVVRCHHVIILWLTSCSCEWVLLLGIAVLFISVAWIVFHTRYKFLGPGFSILNASIKFWDL